MTISGDTALRAEDVESMVKGFALQRYVAKQVVMTSSTNADKNTYWQETATDLTAGATQDVKGIPRLSNFPYGKVTWTEQTGYVLKHGMESVVSWEDWQSDEIDVLARTLLRVARAVVKSVDTEIWATLTENYTPVNINTLAIAAGSEWDSTDLSARDPIQNLLDGIAEIEGDDYNVEDQETFLVTSPKGKADLLGNANVRNAGQFYTDSVTKNGRVGRLIGLTMLKSNNLTADNAIIAIGKLCGTWKQVNPLTVVTIFDQGIKVTVRAWERGQTQLTNPKAVCLITNTEA